MSHQVDSGIPTLRFNDGDVIIKLSTSREDRLLVHTDVLRAYFPMVAAVLKPEWSISEKKVHPKTGHEITISTLTMRFVDGTFLLSDTVCYSPRFTLTFSNTFAPDQP